MIPLVCAPRVVITQRHSEMVVARGWREWRDGAWLLPRCRVSVS